MNKLLISFILTFFTTSSFSDNVNSKTIKSIHVNLSSGYYFKTEETMVDPESCGSTAWYKLSGDTYNKEAYSLMLAAQMSGKKVNFYIDGCSGSYPVVRWINVYN